MVDGMADFSEFNTLDESDFTVATDGSLEIILTADEALIIETDLPALRPYWNIQLSDPYFNAVEYVYRLSSLNGATAVISSDGHFRAVIAMTDPGAPNWLDPAGFTEGTIYGPLVWLRHDHQAGAAGGSARSPARRYGSDYAGATGGGAAAQSAGLPASPPLVVKAAP